MLIFACRVIIKQNQNSNIILMATNYRGIAQVDSSSSINHHLVIFVARFSTVLAFKLILLLHVCCNTGLLVVVDWAAVYI